MYINEKIILILILLNGAIGQIIEQDTQTQSLIKPHIQQNTIKQNCTCLNNGECYQPYLNNQILIDKKQTYCRCSNYFIGKYCQIQAYQISTTKEISQKINIHQYKYFYYQPMEQNMYTFTYNFCLDNKTNNNIKTNDDKDKNIVDSITFFLTAQNQDGSFLNDQQFTKPTTVSIQPDQCKIITVDYTVLLITKIKTIQKLILAIKLGQKINNTIKSDKQKQKVIQKDTFNNNQKIKQIDKDLKKGQKQTTKLTSDSSDKLDKTVDPQAQLKSLKQQKILPQYHQISYTVDSQKKKAASIKQQEIGKKQNIKSINDFKSKSPSKLKQNDDTYASKTIYINFSVYPFMVEFVVFNILFSLTTLAAFIIVGIMIFVIRSRILGIRFSRHLGISSRLINDLRHFDRYIPPQKYIKKEKKQGDISPNSSQIQCAICLVKFQNMDLVRRTPCSHSFHKSCLDTWCHENLTCPMCRKSLTQKNMAQIFNSTAIQLKNSPESDQ